MRYNQPSIATGQRPAIGVLLLNLGTPDAPTPSALRRYLAEFLSDPRVIERPPWLWYPILHGVILRIRPRRAARAYASVWTEGGAPLLAISKRQRTALQGALDRELDSPIRVMLAMRYGHPSVAEGLEALQAANAQRVLVLPLYPQYSATTTASTFDAVANVLRRQRVIPELRMVNSYYPEPGYVRALAASVERYWHAHGRGERLLLSFHGLPQRYVDAGDPYYDQCACTAGLIADELKLSEHDWQMAFQSRFGPEEWLKPYTDETLRAWARDGIRRVDILAPGFAADCLETVEEIAEQNRDIFLEAGGEDYHYIPCLNDDPDHIDFLAELVIKHTQGWL